MNEYRKQGSLMLHVALEQASQYQEDDKEQAAGFASFTRIKHSI